MKVIAFPAPKQRLPEEPAADPAPPAPSVAPPPGAVGGDAPPPQYDRITVRAITVAVALSLFVHFALFVLPLINPVDRELKAPADELGPLSVTIAQPAPQPPAPTPQPRQQAAVEQPKPTPPKQAARPQPVAPRPRSQIAVNTGSRPPFVVPPPQTLQPPTPQVQPAPTPPQPNQDDFSDVIAARQRARRAENGGAPDEVVESDNERANRIAKGNVMAQQRSASPGQDPDQAGGIFDMRHTGITDAEFVFNGWNRNFRRKLGQSIEVRVPPGGDIQLAVVRRMIDIIREQKPGDFEWYNYRTGKTTVMSARPKDQPELERFLMQEFYPGGVRLQGR